MTKVPENRLLKYELIHFQQRFVWDCGLSCVLMVLPKRKRQYVLVNFETICQTEGFGESTWTIDLCYLLKRLGMRHEFWTTVLGVNQGYGSDKFYRDILDKDRIRVNNRFKTAPANGITARKGLLRMDEILLHLSNHGPIILLTNGELLSCKKLTNELRNLFPVDTEYSGHYIVLCGFSSRFGKILYRDPAKSDEICTISFKQLDLARSSFGTDNDIILMFNKKS